MRVLRCLLWFVVGVLLAFKLEVSFASFSPSNVVKLDVYSQCTAGWYSSVVSCTTATPGTQTWIDARNTVDNTCTSTVPPGFTLSANWSGTPIPTTQAQQNYTGTRQTTNGPRYCQERIEQRCPAGSTPQTTSPFGCVVPNSCPANSTLSGGVCTCNAGYQELNSSGVYSCVAACPPDGSLASSGYYDLGTDSSAIQAPYLCSGNCAYTFNGTASAVGTAMVAGVTHYYSKGSMYSTGDTCATNTGSTSASASLPTSTCSGTDVLVAVNGVNKCYSRATQTTTATQGSAPAATQTTTNTATTNPDGSTTITTTITNNLTGEQTTSTATYAPGSTVPTLPSSTTAPIGGGGAGDSQQGRDLCADHPDVEACNTQDAITRYCAAHPDAAQCQNMGTAPAPDDLQTQAHGVDSIGAVSLAENTTCPADVSLPHGLEWSFGPFCTFASNIQPIVLAVSWLSAALILFGMGKSDG